MEGYITIGTKLDTKGIESGISNMQKSLENKVSSLESSISRVGSTIKKIIVGIGIGYLFKQLTNNMDDAIARLDTLANYTKVMSNLGISADDAQKSISYLSDKLIGLPTTLDSAVSAVQRFTSANSNVAASTEMFLALNNAILAGGTPMQVQSSALEQLSQAYAKGKPDMMEWRTAMMAMPAQLKQVATAMGFVDANALGEALRKGTVSMNDFMLTLTKLNKEGIDGFQSFEEQARNATGGVATSMTNVKTAITRGLTQIMDAIGQSNIAGFFRGIANAINKVIPYISAFVKIVVRAVSAISALFGKKIGTATGDVASATSEASSAMGGLADSTEDVDDGLSNASGSAKKLAKELKNLQGFDELNILQEPSESSGSGSGTTVSPSLDMSGFELEMTSATDSLVDQIQAKMMKLFEPIQKSWANYGEPLVNSMKRAFGNINDLIGKIGESFMEVWTNGTGETTMNIIFSILTSVYNIIGNIAEAFRNAWENNNGTQIIQNMWDGFNNLWTIIQEVFKTFEEWTASESFQTFANSIIKLCGKMSEWYKIITDKLKEIWEQGGKDTFANLLDVISKLVELISVVFEALSPLVEYIVGDTGDAVKMIISVIGDVLKALGGLLDFLIGVFTGDWDRAWEGIKTFFSSIWDAILKILTGIWDKITGNIKNSLDKVSQNFKDIWNGIKNFASNIWDGLLNKIDSIFPGMRNIIETNIANVKNKMSEILEKIKSIWNTVWGAVSSRVSEIWDGIRNKASDTWNGIYNAIKGPLNWILEGVETMANGVVNGLNRVIRGLNNMHFQMPDWLGGGSFGINLPYVSGVSLPRLKTGAIVNMPNTGTLVGSAIAGESGREGVIPLTDSQAMEELGRSIGRYITVNANIVNTMNGRVISRELKQIQNEQNFAYNT